MKIVAGRFLDIPDVTLIAIATPMPTAAFRPAIQDRFVLTLVIRSAQGEGVLGPNDERRPLSTGRAKRGL